MRTCSRWPSLIVLLAGVCLAADNKEPDPLKLSDEERAILEWTNQMRAKEKLPLLKPHPLLFQAARSHSANMARKGELRHDLDGKDVTGRVLDLGYDYGWVGENLAGGDGPLAEFYRLWLDSPTHRDSLFKDRGQEIGIGIARDDKRQYYVTVVFGVQRKKR